MNIIAFIFTLRSLVKCQVLYSCRGLREEFTIANPKVEVPVLLIMDGKVKTNSLTSPVLKTITSGKVRDCVAELEIEFLSDGTHFMQAQFPDKVKQLTSMWD